MLARTLIPDFQSSAMSDNRYPDILASQAFAHVPTLIKDRNGTIRLDLSNEMNPSRGDGQRVWQVGYLSRRQMARGFVALSLRRCHIAQPGRRIIGQRPLDKGRPGAGHVSQRREAAARPEGVRPQAVQFFDLAIAFRFGDGQEDQFEAQVQTQSDELPEQTRDFVTATKRGIVVELQKVWNSQGFPSVQRMAGDGLAPLVGGNRLRTRARTEVQGMKRINLGTRFEIATRPIQRVQRALDRGQGFWKISGGGGRPRGHQVVRAQHPADGGRRGRLWTQDLAQFAPDRPGTDQAHFLFDQASARSNDQPHDPRRGSARRMRRPSRVTAQSSRARLVESFLPFA